MFADNDLHLIEQGKPSKGVLKAQEAKNLNDGRVVLVEPDFGDLKPSKEASDWNDFVRVNGHSKARLEINRKLADFETLLTK